MVERGTATLDRTYGALAHPLRREVLERLRGGPARVTDIAAPFDVSLAAVSKHLRVLERAGLVRRAIDGRDRVLALEPQPLAEAEAWIRTHRAFWEERLDALNAHLRDEPDG